MSLLMSPIFAVSLAYSASLEEVLAAGGALGGLPWPSFATEDTKAALKPKKLEGRMARG